MTTINTEQLRAEFEAWWDGLPHSMKSLLTYEVAKQAYELGRAALQSQATEAFPCRIVESDFETGTVTLEMQGKYAVSSGQKYLCDAPLQSQDREDAERYRYLRDSAQLYSHFGDIDNSGWCVMRRDHTLRRVFTYNGPELDEAIDHARRVEGEAK